MANSNTILKQEFFPVKIIITNTDLDITSFLKVGDVVSGQREILNDIPKSSVWVRYGEEKYDWDVFYIGDNCEIISNTNGCNLG